MLEKSQPLNRKDSGKSRHMSIMVPWPLYEKITLLAEQEGRTRSQAAVRLMQVGIARSNGGKAR